MRFSIRHRTLYRYSKPIRLGPQLLRFRPRDEAAQRVDAFRLDVDPAPQGMSEHLDLSGNRVTQVWFDAPTRVLDIVAVMSVETLRRDPFDYILEDAALRLPVAAADAPMPVRAHLERAAGAGALDAVVDGLRERAQGDTLAFLRALNAFVFEGFETEVREEGAPQPVAETLARRRGACRDLAVLFIEGCRAVGIPARFASGYQRSAQPRPERGPRRGAAHAEGPASRRFLHAWPEVYLPGAGWRGYDPTHGSAVADDHVTVCAAPRPEDTLPVCGGFGHEPGLETRLDFELSIDVTDG